MALIKMDFFSPALSRNTSIHLILPDPSEKRRLANGKYPVLWLLHGVSDDHTSWLRFSSVERYARKAGIAVVMPSCPLSFYTNIDGGRYFDYVVHELRERLSSLFPLSLEREDNFIAGFSMGGHGTMKLGFTCPEKFGAMGIISCANFIDLMGDSFPKPGQERSPLFFVRQLVFGLKPDESFTSLRGTTFDNLHLAKQASESGKPLPKIFGACGTCDGCHDAEVENLAYFRNLPNGFDCLFMDSCGMHDFDFWDQWLSVFIQWLPIGERPNRKEA